MSQAPQPSPPPGDRALPAPAVLPEGTRFEGLLVLPGDARVDGALRGEVVARGGLWIGPRGEVEADLEARHLYVEGRVRGRLRARESIALGPEARVDGDLTAPRLSVAEGARLEGRCCCGPPERLKFAPTM